jgi:sulfate/thiosulfate transport system substrate-binding protein
MLTRQLRIRTAVLTAMVILSCGGCGRSPESTQPTSATHAPLHAPSKVTLLNVSYDPTREFYQEFNEAFRQYWLQKTGTEVTVDQSHGGSGKQARSVIDGLEADVVTLALAHDIQAIADKSGLVDADWQQQLPHHSAPYTSTIVFLVRKGNPKHIKDWGDLTREGMSIITPNPKTGGGARWNYLAAWGYALKRELGGFDALKDPAKGTQIAAAQDKAKSFVREIYRRVPVLDSAARGSTNTFVQRGIGDVLLTWENEAFLAVKELGPDKVEVVVPSVSILAQPPVAIVARVAEKHGTTAIAKGYLQHLYSPEGQQLAAKHFYRPAIEESISADQRSQFSEVETFTIDDVFGGWSQAQSVHFDDGGVFDQIYQPGS